MTSLRFPSSRARRLDDARAFPDAPASRGASAGSPPVQLEGTATPHGRTRLTGSDFSRYFALSPHQAATCPIMVRVTGAAGSAGPPGVTDRAGAGVDLGGAVGRAQQGDARGVPAAVPRHPAPPAALPARHGRPGRRGHRLRDLAPGHPRPARLHRQLRRVPRLGRHHRPPPRPGPPAPAPPAARPCPSPPKTSPPGPPRADTAQTAIDAVTTGHAVALIATLPPDQAEAVLLRAVLGLDAATAGTILGKRPGAIRTAAHRGLKTLHKKINRAKEPPAGVAQPAGTAEPAGVAQPTGAASPAGVTKPARVTQTRGLTLKDVR